MLLPFRPHAHLESRILLAGEGFKWLYVTYLRKDGHPALSKGRYTAYDKLLAFSPIHGCHRGGAADFGPENTLYNYERCIKELKTHVLEVHFPALPLPNSNTLRTQADL